MNKERGTKSFYLWIGVILLIALVFGSTKMFSEANNTVIVVTTNIAQVANRVMDEVPGIAERFKEGHIQTTFLSSLPNIHSSGGDLLELATVTSPQFFRRDDERTLAWGWINLGTTVAEIQATAIFRYHLNLSERWELTVQSNQCIVLAPAFRPSLPPAIDSATVQKRAESGWARFDKSEQLEVLERGMTELLSERAAESLQMEAVREICRKSVAEFVRNWLLKEDHWRQDRFSSIIVLFPDEHAQSEDSQLNPIDRIPTLTID